jgi:arylsulfatase A-like enzyme
VPTIVRWPGQIKPAVVNEPMVNCDWLPTLLELAGIGAPDGDGASIAPHLLGKGPLPERKFFWHFPHYNNQGGRPAGAVRDGDWKYILYYDTGRAELYNLKDDVGETSDLAAANVDRVAQLDKHLEEWRKSIGAQTNEPNPDFDPALFKKLYEDFDPSRPPLAKTSAEMEQQMKAWRELMNEVVRGSGPGKKKK